MLTDFRNFFTAIYNNELRNKNLLKFSPHFKSVAALPCKTFIFQQDSAPAHRACDTITLLCQETPDFISPDQWPPNSPDVNPVDYKIWAVMQERVYEKRVNDVDELCQRLLSVAHYWTKRHRRSDRSVACATDRLCASKRGSF